MRQAEKLSLGGPAELAKRIPCRSLVLCLDSQRKVQSHWVKMHGESHPPRSLLLPQYGVLTVLPVPTSGPADPSLRVDFEGCLWPFDISCSGYHADPHQVGREDQAGKNKCMCTLGWGSRRKARGCWRGVNQMARKFIVVDFAGISLMSSSALSLRGALASESLSFPIGAFVGVRVKEPTWRHP